MTSDDTPVLTSWKEIAAHLDVTVRTAQLWEKQRGLPVRRMPGPRSRVYLKIDEYEAWLVGQEGAEHDPDAGRSGADRERKSRAGSPTGAPLILQRSPLRRVVLAAAVAIVGLMLGFFSAPLVLQAQRPGQPAKGYVSGDRLIIEDGNGIELFQRRFEGGLVPGTYSQPSAPIWFADVDGDGAVEVLFSQRHAQPGASDIVFCFSAAGEELWRFEPGGEVAYAEQVFENIYHSSSLRVADLGDGRRVVVVSSIHYIDEPTQIAVLEAETGELMSEYWHSGHIGHHLAKLQLADLNGDGLKEIYAVGVSNGHKHATLVVLDPDTMRGAGEEPPEYQMLGFETGAELARVFFPRSTMSRWRNEYNIAVSVFPNGEWIRVGVSEETRHPANPTVHYDLTREFVLSQISLSDGFRSVHAELVREEAAVRSTVDDELAMLRRAGIEVMRPAHVSID